MAHFHKSAKYDKMIADPSYIPRSCSLDLYLEATTKPKQSKEFVALDAERTVQLEACCLKMTGFVICTCRFNCNALLKRWQNKVSQLLRSSTSVFIVQINIQG